MAASTARETNARGDGTSPWVVVNLLRLTVYLAIASAVSAVGWAAWSAVGTGLDLDDAVSFAGAATGYMILIGGIGCIPGLAVWLILLARMRTSSRVFAVATAPLIGLVWLVLFALVGAFEAALVFGLFWPLGAGFVVRLPSPGRS